MTVKDSVGATGTTTFDMNIAALPALGALCRQTPPRRTRPTPHRHDHVITGGTNPFSTPVVTGLPAGVTASIDGNTITLSGTPTVSGTFNLNVSVTDASGAVSTPSQAYTLTVLRRSVTPPTAVRWGRP